MSVKKSDLTHDQICSIIKICGDAGVRVLKFTGLEIEFWGANPEPRKTAPAPIPDTEISVANAKAEVIQTETISRQEITTKEDYISRLMIEDPLELERLAMSGELEDGDEDQEDRGPQ